MSADKHSLRYYVGAHGKRPLTEWLWSLPDRNAVANYVSIAVQDTEFT